MGTQGSVQMIDFRMEKGKTFEFSIKDGLDTAVLYVYEGSLKSANGKGDIQTGSVILLDADSDSQRGFKVQTKDDDFAGVMLFAGKKLKEPIAWHGTIVMTTQDEIESTMYELRTGRFPPKRVDWDYKRIDKFPKE